MASTNSLPVTYTIEAKNGVCFYNANSYASYTIQDSHALQAMKNFRWLYNFTERFTACYYLL